MERTPRGVRSISERVLKNGRALIVTDEEYNKYSFADLPDGSIHVDTNTGVITVKLKNQTTWTPATVVFDKVQVDNAGNTVGAGTDSNAVVNVQNPTLVISRDTQFNEESFKILEIDVANETFAYEDAEGKKVQSICLNNGKEFVFILEKGSYFMGRNHLEVTLDDCLIRTVMSGGIEEVDDLRFKVLDELVVGQKVTVRYVKWTRIGNPYPRFFLNTTEPTDAQLGDFWVDQNYNFDEDSILEDLNNDKTLTVNWNRIIGTPTTLRGYGIEKLYAEQGHTHNVSDIIAFPKSLPANGGDSNTVLGRKPGIEAGDLLVLNGDACISASMLPNNYLNNSGAIVFQDDKPTNPKVNSLWVCTGAKPGIKLYNSQHKWIDL